MYFRQFTHTHTVLPKTPRGVLKPSKLTVVIFCCLILAYRDFSPHLYLARYQGDIVGLPPPGSELHITGNLKVGVGWGVGPKNAGWNHGEIRESMVKGDSCEEEQ